MATYVVNPRKKELVPVSQLPEVKNFFFVETEELLSLANNKYAPKKACGILYLYKEGKIHQVAKRTATTLEAVLEKIKKVALEQCC